MKNFGGKKLYTNGTSIMAGTGANGAASRYVAQIASQGNAQLVDLSSGGKVLTYNVDSIQYIPLSEAPVQDGTFANALIVMGTNDITYSEYRGMGYWKFREWYRKIITDMVQNKGWQYAQIILATPYRRKSEQAPNLTAPYYRDYYCRVIRELAREYGCMLADLNEWMAGRSDFEDFYTGTDGLHFNQYGHDRIAEYFLTIFDYTPQPISAPDPLLIRKPYATTPSAAVSLSGLNLSAVAIIYEVANPANSFVPGRGVNSLLTLSAGTRYVIAPKAYTLLDLHQVGLPAPATPSSLSGTAEAQAYATARGWGSDKVAALAKCIAGAKTQGLWDLVPALYLLQDSFAASRFNVKAPGDASQDLVAIGSGTFSGSGWTGAGGTCALQVPIPLSRLNNAVTMMVATNTAGADGTATVGARRASLLTPSADGRVYAKWNNGFAYPNEPRYTTGRWFLSGNNDHLQSFVNDRAVTPWMDTPAITEDLGYMLIGNGEDGNLGSTKAFTMAGLFPLLDAEQVDQMNTLLAQLEVDLVNGVQATTQIALLNLPALSAAAKLPAAYVNAVAAKIDEYIIARGLNT